MKSQNLTTDGQSLSRGIHPSIVRKGKGKNAPTLDEIHQRAFEIRLERGGQSYDPDNFLDDWLRAERELREKYNGSNDEARKSNEMDVRKERR